MLELVPEHLLPKRPLRQFSLDFHAINGRSQDIGVILEKVDIVLRELPLLPRIDLQDTERSIIAANNNVYGAPHAMFDQQLRNLETFLACGVLSDHRLVGSQRVPSR